MRSRMLRLQIGGVLSTEVDCSSDNGQNTKRREVALLTMP